MGAIRVRGAGGCSPLDEGGHSFDCWGARAKLADYRFMVGHRLGEKGHGEMFVKHMRELEGKATEAAMGCGVCTPRNSAPVPRNRARAGGEKDAESTSAKRPVSRKRKGDRKMATATKTKTSAAQAFRDAIKVKGLTDEQLIARVRKVSGSKTFDAKTLAWYRTMHKSGKLSKKGREAASSN